MKPGYSFQNSTMECTPIYGIYTDIYHIQIIYDLRSMSPIHTHTYIYKCVFNTQNKKYFQINNKVYKRYQ